MEHKMEMAFFRVLNMSITASFLLAAVICLRFLAKGKVPKRIFCIFWALAAVRLVCPFALESPLSLIPDSRPVAEGRSLEFEQRGTERNRVQGPPVLGEDPEEAEASGTAGYDGEPAVHAAGNGQAEGKSGMTVLKVFEMIWLCGIAAMVCYAVISDIRLRRLVAASAAAGEHIWQCDEIRTPFVLGVVRPRIYLPSDLDQEKEEYVLAHERMHLKRHDHWWKPFGFMILSIHWFNPLCWISYILFCRDIELACDEGVVRVKDEQYKKAYAEALLACSVRQGTVNACPLAFGETSVKERIGNVMSYKKPAFWVVLAAIAACMIVAVCFMTDPQKKGAQNAGAADAESGNGSIEAARTNTDGENENGTPLKDEMEAEDETQGAAGSQESGSRTEEVQGNPQGVRIEAGGGAEGIQQDVPSVVWEQAQQYVQAAFDQEKEAFENSSGTGSSYTEWRIQKLEHCYTYENIAGMTCEIYRMNYEFLAESPEKVTLAGGMEISEDGWVIPECRDSHYLVFSREGDMLTFFCSMYENDCMPGDELFTSDLLNYCFEMGLFDESEGYNPNGEELIRRFREVDRETLHALEYTQDIVGETGILCLGELPEYGIRLYGYNDDIYWRQGVAVEIGGMISYFDWGYMTARIQFPNLYWSEKRQELQITLPIYTGTSFAAQKLVVLRYDESGELQPSYFRLEEFTSMINEILGFQFDEESGTLTLLDRRTGETAGIAQLPGETVYGIWSGDISEFVLGDTIRFRVTPGYLTDAASPQYDDMPAVEFEVEILESENGLAFSIGGLCR